VTVSGQIVEIIMADTQYLLRPIGLVESPLEVLDGTPILDIKPVLSSVVEK
jgi:tRNA (Thr-GGU) A37 N-methylase